MLKEAKRLYSLGFAVHWIKPNSKAPVKSGWSGPQRDSWETVKADYREGYGLGVRMGESSKLADGTYLANIDVDVKSGSHIDEAEALTLMKKLVKGIVPSTPIVKTGHGLRFFVRTKAPMVSRKLGASSEECVVLLPTAPVNRRQQLAMQEGKLTQKQLDQGYRVRPAWEVEFMSSGKQVVLPPSVHPETGKLYEWLRPVVAIKDMPLIKAEPGLESPKAPSGTPVVGFEPEAVEMATLKVSDRIKEMLTEGTGVGDRSAACYSVAIAMLRARCSDRQIQTVLTDRQNFLGDTAYEHANTKRRSNAAKWVQRYCIDKAKGEVDAAKAFRDAVIVTPPPLGAVKAKAQKKALTLGRPGSEDWKSRLKRSGPKGDGPPKPTLDNVLRILLGTYGTGLFREDLFSGYRVYGMDVPWGGKIGEEFSDRERPLLTEWFAKHWGFEPTPNILFDAVAVLAAHNTFHPIQDYLNALRWDGVARIDNWLATYMRAHDTDGLYLREVSRKVLVAMVARAFEPGCQFDYMLILKGEQGIKKSSALGILAGTKYFSSTVLEAGGKEAILKMTAKWILEFGELSTLKADVKALKNFITTRVDRDRLPYGRLAQDFPRKCVFMGTTNRDDFLSDETGNRRFWPVSVQEIDLDGLARDRDQLLAEAKVMYDCGEQLYLSTTAEAGAKAEQAKWTPSEDIMVDQVKKALKQNRLKPDDAPDKFPPEGFRLSEIMACMACRDDMNTQRRVGAALKATGYISRVSRLRGKRTHLWVKG